MEDRLTPAIPAPAITVTNAADVPVAGLLNLREAITAANIAPGQDTINFAPGLYTGGNLTVGLIQGMLPTITDDLKIDGTSGVAGQRVTVEPANPPALFRLFEIATPPQNLPVRVGVEFESLTIRGGNTADPADPHGGGIAMYNATVTLKDCVVEFNGATGNGGGLYSTGDPSQLTLTDNTVVHNNTAGMNGGGIAVLNTNLVLQKGTQVVYNTAGLGGGGVAAFADNFDGIINMAFVTLDGTIGGVQVNNNTANNGDGGGVLVKELVPNLAQGAIPPIVLFTYADVNENTARGVAPPVVGQPWTSGRGGGVALAGGLIVDADNKTNVLRNQQSAPAPTLGVYFDPALVWEGFSANAIIKDNTQLP